MLPVLNKIIYLTGLVWWVIIVLACFGLILLVIADWWQQNGS